MTRRLDSKDPAFASAFEELAGAPRGADMDVREAVAQIIADVCERGDAALADLTERFDRFTLSPETMRIGPAEIAAARDDCPREALLALEMAALRIQNFHTRQIPQDLSYHDVEGVALGYRWTPIRSVGLYVPGGRASYPSSVLMNAVPARTAGVERLVICVPTPEGVIDPLVLAAAELANVDEIWRIGGAQAIAALAFGTAAIAPVDKIVGPGNAWVAEAKRQVFGQVGIDMIAGPSEILVVADGDNDPDWIAADLLSQAEHDEEAQAILITDDERFADLVMTAVESHLSALPRADIARESWQRHGAVITVANLHNEAPALVDRLAPEHLELALAAAEAEALAGEIRNAGAIFLGRHTPEAIGDYVAGPNHVLPTSRSARFSSGLSVFDFLKRTSLVGCDEAALARIGPAAATLADAEGLPAHALSVRIRGKSED